MTDKPFSVTFQNNGKSVEISLVNNEDVFKLASVFQMILLENGIEFKTTTNESDSTSDLLPVY